jgi:terminase, large subunit
MDAEHLVLPEGMAPEEAERSKIDYACNECGGLWDDQQREQAIRTGHWYCVKGLDIHRPSKVGFHHRAWECLDVTLPEIAAAWLRAKQGGIAEKTAWANGIEAIDYEADVAGTIDTEHLLRYRSELPRNLVPTDTARVWLLADTQQSSFYYQVWAAGFAPDVNLHMVRHGIMESFADLEGLLAETWRDADGKEYRITNGLIDSGGTRQGWQKHSRTVEVYEWCSRNRVVMPHKGMHGRTGDLISYKDVASFPGTNKKIPGGLKRANLRVDIFKDDLDRRLSIEPDDNGALSFHCDIDEAFAKHYTTEIRDEHGDWQHHKGKGRNDYWDCTVYALALREMLKLRMPRKEQQAVTGRRILSKGVAQQ